MLFYSFRAFSYYYEALDRLVAVFHGDYLLACTHGDAQAVSMPGAVSAAPLAGVAWSHLRWVCPKSRWPFAAAESYSCVS